MTSGHWLPVGALSLSLCLWVGNQVHAAPIDVEVMTQNLYVGADATPVLQNPSPATIAAAYASVIANNFPARAAAIATEAANAGGPLLIGLQEAAVITAPNQPTLDYAHILINALAADGLNYTEASVHTGFQLAAAGFSITDQEVVLARSGVAGFSVTGAQAQTFANQALFQTPLGNFSPQRGYVLVDASLDGVPFQFVSTHLDETHSSAQALQAGEILSELNTSNEPQLVVGDFNANPTEFPFTYAEMLSAGFTDVGAALGATGPTCCQPADLDNPVSELTNRYDYVFERGFSSLDEALLVGNATPFEDMRPFWPSDHAGLVATVNLSAVVGAVPEPSSAALVAVAMFLLGALKLRTQL
jgi:endonuclease/exonuclease/phosphatase family metal-dependent hydrolase